MKNLKHNNGDLKQYYLNVEKAIKRVSVLNKGLPKAERTKTSYIVPKDQALACALRWYEVITSQRPVAFHVPLQSDDNNYYINFEVYNKILNEVY